MEEENERTVIEGESREVAHRPLGSVPVQQPLSRAVVARTEEEQDIIAQLKIVAMRRTRASHWKIFGDETVYLEEEGAMVFADVFQVSFFDQRVEKDVLDDDKGRYIDYNVTLRAAWRNKLVEADGGRSTKDPFFNKTDKETKEVIRLPLSEISTSRVRRAAVTNARARATKRILALSFTKEDLAQYVPRADRIKGIGFEGGRKSGKTKSDAGIGTSTPEKEQIRRMVLEMAGGKGRNARPLLKRLTKNDEKGYKGYETVDRMTDKAARTILEHIIQPAYEEWLEKQAIQDADEPPDGEM